jgi:Glycoside hydrolase family 44/Cell wall binding domain 2 (CWB2)
MPRRRALLPTCVPAVLLVAFAGVVSAAGPAGAAASGPALTVDVSAGRHAISPDIYGMNYADGTLATELGLTTDRWGGNSTSRYNYQNNTYNTGSDYYFENIVADRSLDSFVAADLAHGTHPVVTVPALGWVAKDSPSNHPFACGFKVSKYGAQQSTDPWDTDCGNGVHTNGSNITGNSPSDTSIAAGGSFVQGMVAHLVQKFGTAAAGGVNSYEIDNEPTLWNSTHRDVHPSPLSYDELWSKSLAAAQAVKAADPTATVDGPGDWGWCAYFYAPDDPGGCGEGPDKQAHGDLPLAAWYLQQFHTYDQQHGERLLDYFDEHFYPQESGVSLSGAGDSATQALRLRSTRALWDPTYTDESWTADLGLGPVELIPRMKQWVAQYYPGTKIAISEYNWGGLESMNGALAEADVLGIFGREGVDRAQLWSPPSSGQPGAFAFRIYRNYDGQGGRFGDTSVKATSSDQSQLAVYAAQRSSDAAVTIVVINKTGTALTSTLSLAGTSASAASVYGYSGANLGQIVPGAPVAIAGNAFTYTYPANSITLFVSTGKVKVSRIAGANRDATAAALAKAGFPAGSAQAVVLARDDVYADALTGSPLADVLGGPLLLTPPASLSADARSAITSVLAAGGTIDVLGGSSAVSDGVVATLTGLGYHVQRFGGTDRYATAGLVADEIAAHRPVSNVYLATGLNFADAESAAGAAASQHGVVLLTNGTAMADATRQWLAGHSGVALTAIGGPAAAAAPSATPIIGSDRYATSARTAAAVLPAPTGLVLATGAAFPDGLAAATYAAHNGWAMLLVAPSGATLNADQRSYLHGAAATVTTLVVSGGTAALPDTASGVVLGGLS